MQVRILPAALIEHQPTNTTPHTAALASRSPLTTEGRPVKLIINTMDGSSLTIEDFNTASIMDMIDQWEHHPILTIGLDTGVAYIPKTAVTRIDTIDT